jgi:hypothetical protein
MYASWFAMLSVYTAQNTIHLEFNFSLLILDKISSEAGSCDNGSDSPDLIFTEFFSPYLY